MNIADRLRALRKDKKLSQAEIEERTGLLRCYVSRVENGHTVPNLETLEKFARALEIPLSHLFYEGEEPPALPRPPERKTTNDKLWGSSGKEARLLSKFRRLLSLTDERSRSLLLFMAQRMATRRHTRSRSTAGS